MQPGLPTADGGTVMRGREKSLPRQGSGSGRKGRVWEKWVFRLYTESPGQGMVL